MLKSSAALLTLGLLTLGMQPALAADTMPTITIHPSIDRACQDALHVGPNDSLYAACVASLKDTLSATKKMHAERCQTACSEAGLTEGSPAFDRCVANLNGALAQAQLSGN
ncbi:hypothetical protein UCD39_24640 [Nitrospirillum sp. BR 11752]|uniref:Cysteine rich repeat protein n=1 Tax=Nitrospirillum amazonense TaxID=28077 RepID=A0A560HFD8_9PROT|nr:hypothetical protein [Nitrospirillum amazonense]MEE3627128.1 hypothetical protein [Nitrospirillum sp. BR 11752]TWB44204.1 hypothetical protein FBZ90_103110 [Nitrospirillum amazonense]